MAATGVSHIAHQESQDEDDMSHLLRHWRATKDGLRDRTIVDQVLIDRLAQVPTDELKLLLKFVDPVRERESVQA